jgi:hypothetical protein
MMSKNIKSIVVTDAGFTPPWSRELLALDWDFVGQTRKPSFYTHDKDETWYGITQLYAKATATPKVLNSTIHPSKPLECRFISYKQKAKRQHYLNRAGQPRQSKHSKIQC